MSLSHGLCMKLKVHSNNIACSDDIQRNCSKLQARIWTVLLCSLMQVEEHKTRCPLPDKSSKNHKHFNSPSSHLLQIDIWYSMLYSIWQQCKSRYKMMNQPIGKGAFENSCKKNTYRSKQKCSYNIIYGAGKLGIKTSEEVSFRKEDPVVQ